MYVKTLAKLIVDQWDKYDKWRVPANESKEEPDNVKIARAYLETIAYLENKTEKRPEGIE